MTLDHRAALLDTNVLVAIVCEEHIHHAESWPLVTTPDGGALVAAAHSVAEAYVTLTRQGAAAPARYEPARAWAVLESVWRVVAVRSLTAAQTLATVRSYAQSGGIGARLYDALIGEVAVVHQVATIVTWNVRHMRGLFPKLTVVSPPDFLAGRPKR